MYYYRPRRSTTRPRREQRHSPHTETVQTHDRMGAPGGVSGTQTHAAPILDTHTVLLLLVLMERLAEVNRQEQAFPPPIETGEQVVESEPPTAAVGEEVVQDVPYPPRSLHKHRLTMVLLVLCGLACMMVIVVSFVSLVTASATVTILPVQEQITATTTLSVITTGTANLTHWQIPGRRLSSLTLSQEETVPTTGLGHQPARAALGTVTFYNAAPFVQTIGAGTLLTGSNGVQVVTEQDAVIPSVAYPTLGQVTVLAQAVIPGPAGNIRAGEIYGPCCRLNVSAVNSTFGGGQDARSYPMVTAQDLSGAASTLKASLAQSARAAFGAQLHTGEMLITPVPCTSTVSADHTVGGEATHLTVTVDATCRGEAYQTQAMQIVVTQVLIQQATAHLGTEYSLSEGVQVAVTRSTVSNQKQDTLQVSGTGTWVYQFDDSSLQHMAHLIAGKSEQQATKMLLQLPGVSQISLNVSGGSTTLPADASRIHLLVLFRW